MNNTKKASVIGIIFGIILAGIFFFAPIFDSFWGRISFIELMARVNEASIESSIFTLSYLLGIIFFIAALREQNGKLLNILGTLVLLVFPFEVLSGGDHRYFPEALTILFVLTGILVLIQIVLLCTTSPTSVSSGNTISPKLIRFSEVPGGRLIITGLGLFFLCALLSWLAWSWWGNSLWENYWREVFTQLLLLIGLILYMLGLGRLHQAKPYMNHGLKYMNTGIIFGIVSPVVWLSLFALIGYISSEWYDMAGKIVWWVEKLGIIVFFLFQFYGYNLIKKQHGLSRTTGIDHIRLAFLVLGIGKTIFLLVLCSIGWRIVLWDEVYLINDTPLGVMYNLLQFAAFIVVFVGWRKLLSFWFAEKLTAMESGH